VSESLLDRPIPAFVPAQIESFTQDSIRAQQVANFNPNQALDVFTDQRVAAIDIGGDTISAQFFRAENRRLVAELEAVGGYQYRSESGQGYRGFIERVAERIDTPVGVSFAGEVREGLPVGFPNLPVLREQLGDNYREGFKGLLPTLKTTVNDAVAGVMAGSVESAKRDLPTKNLLYVISGSGLGGAVLKDGQIFSSEPGHLPVVPELNRFGQTEPCGAYGQFVCLERAGAASRAGVESLYRQITGQKLDGRKISERFQDGDTLAAALYDSCARQIAHISLGMMRAFDLSEKPDGTTIVFHGGTFKVPTLAERVGQILGSKEYLGSTPNVIVTHDFSRNACLDGAAIAALVAK
jgi:predicted NBD/HSP70 family sugar kinase